MKINCYGIDCTGWEYLHPQATPDTLGYIPSFIAPSSSDPLREQIDDAYISGWNDFKGLTFNLNADPKKITLTGYGDPPYPVLAMYEHKPTGEKLYLFDCAWVCIVQPGGAYNIARLD